jgi:tRNA threonylcarbamoyladenosine biosynthesis protein TsaB
MAGASLRSPALMTSRGLILALDTSGQEGSAAVARLGPSLGSLQVLATRTLRSEEEHASLLVPRILELLEEASVSRGDLAGIVVGAGPGSFTGVRVGAATAKGVAWALDLPLWAFSSLAAGAAGFADAAGQPLVRCVLFDARGDRLYAGAYAFREGVPETLLDPRATTVEEILHGLIPSGAVLMGDGARRHGKRFQDEGLEVLPPPAGRPTALGLLRLLAVDAGQKPLDDPGRWEPCYLRESGAERTWKTRRTWKG